MSINITFVNTLLSNLFVLSRQFDILTLRMTDEFKVNFNHVHSYQLF